MGTVPKLISNLSLISFPDPSLFLFPDLSLSTFFERIYPKKLSLRIRGVTMPRIARSFISNAVSHIITRGNQRQKVFKDESDFRKYLQILWKYKNDFQSSIFAYCLMSNHVHLVLQTLDKPSLSKMMHSINLSYAMYFNYKYKKCGHLWQDRYKSYMVQKDKYLLNLITYVEMNPLRAQICSSAEEYPWSSYRHRILGDQNKLLDKLVL